MPGEPGAGQVGEDEEGGCRGRAGSQVSRETEGTAKARGEQLEFPLVFVVLLVRQQHLARDQSRPRQVAPAPKLWRRGTGDSGDGGGVGVVFESDAAADVRGQGGGAV